MLLGLDEAACKLGVSRERLVLALPVAADRRALARELGSDEAELARQLKAGLVRAVDRLDRAGRLPKASALLPAVVAELDLPGPVETLVDAIPADTVDSLAPTGPGAAARGPQPRRAGRSSTGSATPTGWRACCATRSRRPRWRRSGSGCSTSCRIRCAGCWAIDGQGWAAPAAGPVSGAAFVSNRSASTRWPSDYRLRASLLGYAVRSDKPTPSPPAGGSAKFGPGLGRGKSASVHRAAADMSRTRSLGLLSFALYLTMPVVLAAAVALGEWWIAVAIVPLFAADWFVDRAWAKSGGGLGPGDRAHARTRRTTWSARATESPTRCCTSSSTRSWCPAARFTYRFALRAHVLLRPLHWAGFVLALVALPQNRLLAAAGVFIALAADNSGRAQAVGAGLAAAEAEGRRRRAQALAGRVRADRVRGRGGAGGGGGGEVRRWAGTAKPRGAPVEVIGTFVA